MRSVICHPCGLALGFEREPLLFSFARSFERSNLEPPTVLLRTAFFPESSIDKKQTEGGDDKDSE
jgi:hypothetical protein